MTTKILDCTLRDGGYYNNWAFKKSFVKKYLKLMDHLPIDYVEIGFRKDDKENKFGKFFSIADKYIKSLTFNKKFKIALMIDFADFKKNLNIKDFFKEKKKTNIDLVRIASEYNDLKYLPKIINELTLLGYKVAVNLMKVTQYNYKQIVNFFIELDNKKIEFLYIADSFGNCNPKFIKELSEELFKNNIPINKIGFHAHDNMSLAYKNALQAEKTKFGIVDTSVLGMGRGAGNLRLEDYLQKRKLNLNQKKLIKNFIFNDLKKLKVKYKWGPNKFYRFAAKNFIHPTYIQRLIEDRKFNNKQIKEILNFLKTKDASKYDINIFDSFFYKKNIQTKFKKINLNNNFKVNLILNNEKNINKLIRYKTKNSYTALLNYSKYIYHPNVDFLFICNPYRIITEIKFFNRYKKILIAPSLSKFFNKRINSKICFYDILFAKKLKIKKNHCMFKFNLVIIYSLAFLISKGFKHINIYGLTKNKFNLNLLNEINKFINKKNLTTRINF